MSHHFITRVFLIASFLTGLTACEESQNWISEKNAKGTLRGIVMCMKKNENDLIKKKTLRYLCTNKHQILIKKFNVSWRSGFEIDDNIAKFDISGTNEENYVVTKIYVNGIVYDKSGKKQSKIGESNPLWVEPGRRFSASIKVDHSFPIEAKKTWCSNIKVEEDKNKSCRSWEVKKIYSVPILDN